MSTKEHKANAPKQVGCMVITVSDTRTEETDKSGQLMMELLREAGHLTLQYRIVKDEPAQVITAIEEGVADPAVQAILLNGGTGISPRDNTFEAVSGLLDKEIPGFGELFRMLSYTEDIGSAAILSRAVAGVKQGKAIFSTPGSTGAVRLAMNRLIVPELGHVIRELTKKG
ncbi:MogA/MoaB family molybdenum cofactor biosynthesis protein [Brevibacillus borstelensis]|uniref:MogA/MoaB family molybdenum cofactor biosynthesis protein n=1 Tax=Brevibacillus borstelensis TaxID=45462 RepID=UPI000F084621|nr:molybdenum cofactor biosynthesis protein B [Brevibacillus borstelensis]MCM3621640.1 molybdenum cofactor biosynthesis protein MoaB [Brevibacillus borstelensis]MED1884123.1 molybdenum cofactor biosynthesis protein MoaB [Brevibacillus borstelensis]RNB63534.1 molybdenum cofactor biosynthesis protein MoaB [Brevibacillus borstelensis]GED50991.1 molybdenum cofactor biosynthesis protein B [Brevibacillus borstelensis]